MKKNGHVLDTVSSMPVLACALLLALGQGCLAESFPEEFERGGVRVRLLAENGVGPSWIRWKNPKLPAADLVYVDAEQWELFVMDENGGNKRCLTKKGANAIGADFPLDADEKPPSTHWKGDPETHPSLPLVLFKAENENSRGRALRNSPSIGWDNDLWALNVDTGRYTRLTRLAKGQGLQHSALSHDGKWHVYPLRYDFGDPPRDFGLCRLVFNEFVFCGDGEPSLAKRFEAEPNGPMYYEPIDVVPNPAGGYTLLYVAGAGAVLDPYRLDWSFEGGKAIMTSRRLKDTPDLHEEFTVFSPDGNRIAWMRGPKNGLKYQADLYVSAPDFSGERRLTWFNVPDEWPGMARRHGAQLSRLCWKGDGTALFFGLWTHGPMLPFRERHLYRIDF